MHRMSEAGVRVVQRREMGVAGGRGMRAVCVAPRATSERRAIGVDGARSL
jgi:hypothetical protein